MLPVLAYKKEIRDRLSAKKALIVTAPPGTGKSTQIPQFIIDDASPEKQIIVLEPRRIAARTLAARVAEELGSVCGDAVGYQIRFERKISAGTRIVFLTYGTFLQLLQSDPLASHSSIIVFDEFHERTLDADQSLAWVRFLMSGPRPDLRMMVLSATLETEPLRHYLHDCDVLAVPENSYPVDIRYQSPKPMEQLTDQVCRAFANLHPMAELGSVLVFLPGVYEIERTATALHNECVRRGYKLLTLHGKMQAGEQQKVLITPSQEPCVILSTNVAETSLTIPGVVAVIDSGLARRAAYDSERERNTLFVARITLQNAAQRAGRAGRLTKGVCVRLWGKDEERGMAAVIEPEVLKLDLASTVLSLCACYGQVRQSGILPEFLTPPPVIRWEKACQELARCGALSRTNDVQTSPNMLYPLTSFGVSMSKLPAEPVVAAILLESRSREEREINIAMAALWESSEASFAESKDLFDLAESFIADSRQKDFAREIHETVRQFERLLHGTLPAEADSDLRELVTRLWMRLFSHRIAAKGEGSVYTFQNRSVARLVRKKETVSYDNEFPGLIVALVVHERGGRSQTVKATIPLYLPLEESLVAEAFSGEISTNVTCRFDDSRRRPILEKSTRFRGLVFGSRELEKSDKYQELITACLVSKLKENIWDWKSDEPAAEQFLYRLKLAAAAFPGMGIPAMSDDDWELVYHELCENKKTLEEIQKGSMLRAIKSYIGQELVRFIEKNAPEIIMLPNGRRAKIIYSEAAPPEISARLGDFIGYKERFLVMQGRVQGVFDILAPNYRTVQKTADLGSFWKNTYPSIKQELQRKYPRHPWP